MSLTSPMKTTWWYIQSSIICTLTAIIVITILYSCMTSTRKHLKSTSNQGFFFFFRGKKDELLLRELLKRWPNHKERTRQISKYFSYLDRYHVPRHQLPSLREICFISFYYLVYDELNKQVMDAILAMIDQKHAGEPIDETLVNKALTFYSII